MNDPIADLLTRIRNAYQVNHKTVDVPCSKIKQQIVKLLEKEGYLKSSELIKENSKKILRIALKYKNKKPAVDGIKRVSKPGRRIFMRVNKIPRTLGGYGITVISTSKGVMTDFQARKLKIGGEIICQVW